MDRRSLILLGALALAGCATTRRPASTPALLSASDIIFQALEPLLAVSNGPGGLVIRMASNGCAAKANIAFHMEMRNGAAYVAFARRTMKDCPLDAQPADLAFAPQELGLGPDTPIFLLNPVVAGAKTAPPSSPEREPGGGSRY